MSTRKEDRVMRKVGIQSWEEIETARQFGLLISYLYKMKTKEAARILSQIEGIKTISDDYFDEMSYTFINHEPLIMFEMEETRECVNSLLDVAEADFEKLAEVFMDFSEWIEVESSIFMENGEHSSFVSVSEALEAIRSDGDDIDTDEKISMAYEGTLSSLGLSGETGHQPSDIEMAIEAVLQEAGWESKARELNSRLN